VQRKHFAQTSAFFVAVCAYSQLLPEFFSVCNVTHSVEVKQEFSESFRAEAVQFICNLRPWP